MKNYRKPKKGKSVLPTKKKKKPRREKFLAGVDQAQGGSSKFRAVRARMQRT